MRVERGKLAIGVIGEVAGGLVQLDASDMRGIDRLIADFQEFGIQEVLQLAANDGPLGEPENQPRTDHGVDSEQLQLLAQQAVIAAFGLFDLLR